MPKKKEDQGFQPPPNASGEEVLQFIERIERLIAEAKDTKEQEKEVYAELKGRGYNVKIIKKIIGLRARSPDDRANEEAELNLYLDLLGMQSYSGGDGEFTPPPSASADEVRQFVERIERLQAEVKDINEQQKEVYAELKGRGYNAKIIKQIVAMRARSPDDRANEEAEMDLYKGLLGLD